MRAEGQELQRKKTSRSPWMIVVYIFAVLFGFLLLMMLVSFGISLCDERGILKLHNL